MNACARVTLLAVWLLVSLGGTGWADTTAMHFKVKGDTAVAGFEAVDPQDRCIEYTVFVVASDLMEKESPTGQPSSTARTLLIVEQEDLCAEVLLLSGEGETPEHTFQVASNLRAATLTATVTVFDSISVQLVNFEVNLTWTAVGEPVNKHDTEIVHDTELGLHLVAQFRGRHAPAVATGTVLGLGLNFTPEPSTFAEIQTRNDGSILIQQTM
jgi:hypothetical protein